MVRRAHRALEYRIEIGLAWPRRVELQRRFARQQQVECVHCLAPLHSWTRASPRLRRRSARYVASGEDVPTRWAEYKASRRRPYRTAGAEAVGILVAGDF